MTAVIKTTFLLKRATSKRWSELNPILQQGEPGFAYDTNVFKIGDGTTPWNDLVPPYENEQDKPIIDPIFANNSWETIAWVAKNDDPSKYWKVGDYKMLEIPYKTGAYLTYRKYPSYTGTTFEWDLPILTALDGSGTVGSIEIVDIPKFIATIKQKAPLVYENPNDPDNSIRVTTEDIEVKFRRNEG